MGRFVKGQSGNPGGRPKAAIDVRDLARTHTKAAMDALVDCMEHEDGAVRVSAARTILDRAWGKPSQAIAASVHGPLSDSFAEILAGIDRSKSDKFVEPIR